jgi:hypothetical protein
MATPSAIPLDPNRESSVRIHRQTRELRHLWYQLTVLQQPERARACGAGTKANSDRRPVDPPPVVELRIREGSSWDEGKEITFDYNASFFLYASLEQHRKIAHGRMQGQPNPPILTGVPASGMAYLDRPSAAGYFIFPDLSVRHEGQYRLAFSLFETTKEEKDFDLEPADANLPTGVDWRMEIKTAPFDVYSAKKFPGLMESTPLSKEVADQGCRVRIRRDVRMRKREGKSGGHERREEGFSRRRTVTPATEDPSAAAAHARSMSNSSEHRAPYAAEASRRPSVPDGYHAPPPPSASQSGYEPAGRGHLSFGDSNPHQYAAPRPYTHQPLAPISPSGSNSSTVQYVKPEPQPYTYAPPSRGGPPPPVSPALRQHESQERRSNGYLPPSPSVYSTASSHSRHDSHMSYASTPIAPAPVASHIRLARIEPRIEPAYSRGNVSLPPLKISDLCSPNSSPIEAQEKPTLPPVSQPPHSKRKYESVFTQSAQALHNGQRQLDAHHGGRKHGWSTLSDHGTFKRADGTIDFVLFNQYFY